jgi:hypothetical protein
MMPDDVDDESEFGLMMLMMRVNLVIMSNTSPT